VLNIALIHRSSAAGAPLVIALKECVIPIRVGMREIIQRRIPAEMKGNLQNNPSRI
jgi:hypothetical protein